jgi:uncharacterized membrane-anchored protein YhcB (DUF1043 family)
MSKSFGTVLAFIAGIVITYLIVDNIKKNIKIKELQKEIDDNDDLNLEIKKKLSELIQNNKEIDPKVANELTQMVTLLEVKQDTSAVLKLNKVIENLLKELYKGDAELKELAKTHGRKNPVFADYLEHAKIKKVISTEDYHLLSVMKGIRNDEAHELAVHPHKAKIFAAFISGLSLILGLCRLLKRKTIEPEPAL